MKFLGSFILSLSFVAPLGAQDKRPLGVDDFLRIGIVGDPQISPNGALVAYPVTTPSLADDRNISRLRVLDLVTGSSRELTSGPCSDRAPRWAKDGLTLAFLSNRNGTSQVWRTRIDVSEGIQAFTALQLQRIPSKFLYFPDEGHFVLKPRNRRLWWGVVLDWLDEYLRPGTAKTNP